MAQTENNILNGINVKKYKITCPYCFEKFYHTDVHFRSDLYYVDEKAVENDLGISRIDIEMMSDIQKRNNLLKQYDVKKAYILGKDYKYSEFWRRFVRTSEVYDQNSTNPGAQKPWELPIIDKNLISEYVCDGDGFVYRCEDILGNSSDSRVCPHCHNPLPLGYGKNETKYISIIGVTGSGKTVYISQFLKYIKDNLYKVGLTAFRLSRNESNFVDNNAVTKDKPLPQATDKGMLTQPMYYDVVRTIGEVKKEETIVLYDIAGENCEDADKMLKFAEFVEHSDGIILLVDPKQLRYVDLEENDKFKEAATVLNTLHSIIKKKDEKTGKAEIPIAICISKSDMCYDILPSIASDDVCEAEYGSNGLPKQEFDGRSYNRLQEGLLEVLRKSAGPFVGAASNHKYCNFFALSAIGCDVEDRGGEKFPISEPNPKRIEEPMLWLFKQKSFAYIGSNAPVAMPFPCQQKIMKTRKRKGLFGLFGCTETYEDTVQIKFEEELN